VIEVFALFKDFVVTHAVTENPMIASAYVHAWVIRYPHARIEESKIKRAIADDFGNSIPRQVTEIRIRINENVPNDLRA
jgi:hypothetical protein